MALDHATQQLLREFSADPDAVPFSELEPHQARAVSASRSAQFIPGPELHQVQDFRLPVSDGGTMRMRILTPQPDPHAVVVYFHGGGWVIGNIDTYDSMARTLAAESHATVVLAEYRKAPEHPFPIPLEDSWTAYQWVTQNRDTLTAPGSPVFLAGDSAGGNLAAVIARRARDHAGIQPDGQILLYPVVDHDFERDSYLEPENQTLLPVQAMQYFWDHYLPEVTERDRKSVV